MRIKLAPFRDKRSYFTATVGTMSQRWNKKQIIPVTLLTDIKHGKIAICDHAWVAQQMPGNLENTRIEFYATVRRYKKEDSHDYCLTDIRGIKIVSEGDLIT